MANKNQRSVKYPDLPDTYVINQIAAEFDSATSYAVGDYCNYLGQVYRFTAAHSGAWTGTDAEAVYIAEEMTALETSLDDYAKIDGYYDEMAVGSAEQLISTVLTEDKVPYNFRTSGGSADVGNRMTDSIVGGTVVWNQLVRSTDTSVTVSSGHKYIGYIGGAWGIGESDGTPITADGANGDLLFDLTNMYGTAIANYYYGLGSTACISWFRDIYPRTDYAYNAGELMSVQASAHNMTGFNQWDEEWHDGYGYWSTADGEYKTGGGTWKGCANYIPILPNTTYYLHVGVSGASVGGVCFYDKNKNFVKPAWPGSNYTFTTPDNAYYMTFYAPKAIHEVPGSICINLSWSGYRNGEYEPYELHSYPLDDSLTLRGIPKLDANNELYYDGDTYESDGTVTRRYGVRAYASGDESDATVITDLTNTVYPLSTPTTEAAEPYQNPQIVDDFGTEEYVDAGIRDVEIPVGHVTQYQANLRDKLQHLPDLADSDGTYAVQQSGSQLTLVPMVTPTELPAAPTTDGTYVLKATVTDGAVTYTWGAQS